MSWFYDSTIQRGYQLKSRVIGKYSDKNRILIIEKALFGWKFVLHYGKDTLIDILRNSTWPVCLFFIYLKKTIEMTINHNQWLIFDVLTTSLSWKPLLHRNVISLYS